MENGKKVYNIEELTEENEQLKKKNCKLRKQVAELLGKIDKLEKFIKGENV